MIFSSCSSKPFKILSGSSAEYKGNCSESFSIAAKAELDILLKLTSWLYTISAISSKDSARSMLCGDVGREDMGPDWISWKWGSCNVGLITISSLISIEGLWVLERTGIIVIEGKREISRNREGGLVGVNCWSVEAFGISVRIVLYRDFLRYLREMRLFTFLR